MTERMLKVLPLGVFGSLVVVLVAIHTAPAQEPIPLVAPGQPPVPLGPRVAPLPTIPPIGRSSVGGQSDPVPLPLPAPGQPAQPAQGDGVEVLAKGPVHEAFASTAEAPAASPVVAKQPPEPIEELPPDQKPEGDNVQWLPGYWHWDEDSSQFIWVSGFWRQPPPGRVWVPGSWREAAGGWQYVPGFWQVLAPRQPQQPQQPLAQVPAQPEIEYLPQPPVSLEVGPTVVAPSATSVYVPGSWVWRGKYVWRPGVWVEYRSNWVWTPARYHWTPAGYVFIDGYWDYPLATRGVLFAPIAFSRPIYARPAYVYTPVYVISEPCMTGALFVRRGHGSYYFGDYFEPRYATVGYSAWCGTVGRNGFVVGFGVGRSWGYDPLWSYYSVTYRDNPRWHGGVNELYVGRYRGDIARPPTTLVQQNVTINNITKTNVTNVTNNITVVNGATTINNHNVSNVAMVAPLKVAPALTQTKFVPVSAENQRTEAAAAKQIRDVGTQRTKLETAVVNQPKPVATPGVPQPAAQPRSIKLDVPKAAAQRAVVSTDEKKAPPPAPHAATASPGAKVDHPTFDPKPPVNPLPKVDPKVPVNPGTPSVNPLPKVDPKLPVVPKVDPKTPPKIDPKAPPKGPPPKGDTKPHPKDNQKPPLALAPAVVPPQPQPVAVAPVVQPKVAVAPVVQPKPIVAAPVVSPQPVAIAPVVQPKVQPAPPAQPRPAAVVPAAPTVKVIQPTKPQPPAVQPKAQPAPIGKPAKKSREDR